MRCARCDRIAVPQALGRLPDGRLVFGWCVQCLAETGCERIEPAPATSTVPQHRVGHSPAFWKSRVQASLGGLGLLAAWGVILAYLWGWKLAHPVPHAGLQGLTFGSRTIVSFLGAVILALLSLIAWTLVLGRGRNRHFLLRAVQVGSTLTAFATLCWGIVRHEPRRDPAIVAIVAASLAISLAVRRLDRRFAGVPNLATAPRGSLRQKGRTH